MNFHEFGDPRAPAVMLVHGAGNAWWSFLRQARALEGRFRVVLPTLDGHAEECEKEYVSAEEEAGMGVPWGRPDGPRHTRGAAAGSSCWEASRSAGRSS